MLSFTVRTPQDLARALRRGRTEAGLSQADVAARTGVDPSYISKIEGGRSSRLLNLIFDLLGLLDLHVTISSGDPDRG